MLINGFPRSAISCPRHEVERMLLEHVTPTAPLSGTQGAAQPTHSQPMSSAWRGARKAQVESGRAERSEDAGTPCCSKNGDWQCQGHEDTSSDSTAMDHLVCLDYKIQDNNKFKRELREDFY